MDIFDTEMRKKKQEEEEQKKKKALSGDTANTPAKTESISSISSENNAAAGNITNSSAHQNSAISSKQTGIDYNEQSDSYILSGEHRDSTDKTIFAATSSLPDNETNLPYQSAAVQKTAHNPPSSDKSEDDIYTEELMDMILAYTDSLGEQELKWFNDVARRNAEIRDLLDMDAFGHYIEEEAFLPQNIDPKVLEYSTDYQEDVFYAILNQMINTGNYEDIILNYQIGLEDSNDLLEYAELVPYMQEDQKQSFYALYNSGDKEGAHEYLDLLRFGLDKQRQDALIEKYGDWMDGSALVMAAMSAYSLALDFSGKLKGVRQGLGELFGSDEWDDLSAYNTYYDSARVSEFIRSTVGNAISENTPSITIGGYEFNPMEQLYYIGLDTAGSMLTDGLFGVASPILSPVMDIGGDIYNSAWQHEIYGLESLYDENLTNSVVKYFAAEAAKHYLKTNAFNLPNTLPRNIGDSMMNPLGNAVSDAYASWSANTVGGLVGEAAGMTSDLISGQDTPLYYAQMLQIAADEGISVEEAKRKWVNERLQNSATNAAIGVIGDLKNSPIKNK